MEHSDKVGRQRPGGAGRLLAVLATLVMFATLVSPAAAAAANQTTVHSVAVRTTGTTSHITVDATVAAAHVNPDAAYRWRLVLYHPQRPGSHLATVRGTMPVPAVGRQTISLESDALAAIPAGTYQAQFKLNGPKLWLTQNGLTAQVTTGSQPQPTPTPPPDPATLKQYVAGLPQNASVGLDPGVALQIATASNLPTGTTLKTSPRGPYINVSTPGVTLSGWDFEGWMVRVAADDVTLRGNRFGERTGPSGHYAYVVVAPTADNATITGNHFLGFDGEGGAGMAINHGFDKGTVGKNLRVSFNRFENLSSDGVKLSGEGAVIEWNAFLLARNVNAVPSAWNSGTAYNVGEYAMNGQKLFRSLVPNNRTALPNKKKSTAQWASVDPHVDHITLKAGRNGATIRFNYFASGGLADRVYGQVNALRLLRNRGTSYVVDQIRVEGNYITPNATVLNPAIATGSGRFDLPGFNGPIQLFNNWIGGQKNSAYVGVDGSATIQWSGNVDAITDAPIAAPAVANIVGPVSSAAPPPAIVSGHTG